MTQSLFKSASHPFLPDLQKTFPPKPKVLGRLHFDRMLTPQQVSHGPYQVSPLTCQVSRVRCHLLLFSLSLFYKVMELVWIFFGFLDLFWIFGFFLTLWIFFIFFFYLIFFSVKVTKVTTKCYHGYYRTAKIAKNGPQQHKSTFFARRAKKASVEALHRS